jgi:hypothetical protein
MFSDILTFTIYYIGCFDMEDTTESISTGKKRSQEAKVGRIKYTLQLIKEIRRDIAEVKLMQRTIFSGLKGFFNFGKPFIEKICCVDEVDVAILQVLYEAGSGGVFPKDIASKLAEYKITRHHVSRRLLRMNKRLEKELGQRIAEKRGHHWALTGFAVEVWGETEKEEG